MGLRCVGRLLHLADSARPPASAHLDNTTGEITGTRATAGMPDAVVLP